MTGCSRGGDECPGSSRPLVTSKSLRASTWIVLFTAVILASSSAGAQSFTMSVPAGTPPTAVAVNPLTGQLYIADNGGASVTVVSGSNNAVVATIPVG